MWKSIRRAARAALSALALIAVNKKGFEVSYKMIMWIPRLLFTVIVVSLTFFVISAFISGTTNVSDVESSILMNSAYYAKSGFSHIDARTERAYPAVIEASKFSSAQIQALFKREKPLLVGRFVKRQAVIDDTIKKEEPVTAYSDEERFKLWQPIAQSGARGEGGMDYFSERRYVAASDGKGAFVEATFIVSN